MVPEVVTHLGGEVAAAVFPRFGHEHRDRVSQVASAAQQELQGGVELAGIRVEGFEHRAEQLLGSETGGL